MLFFQIETLGEGEAYTCPGIKVASTSKILPQTCSIGVQVPAWRVSDSIHESPVFLEADKTRVARHGGSQLYPRLSTPLLSCCLPSHIEVGWFGTLALICRTTVASAHIHPKDVVLVAIALSDIWSQRSLVWVSSCCVPNPLCRDVFVPSNHT